MKSKKDKHHLKNKRNRVFKESIREMNEEINNKDNLFNLSSIKAKNSDSKPYRSCYPHPRLKLGGGVVSGGSCINEPEGYDIYVSLDHGVGLKDGDHPWKNTSQHIRFFIDDFSTPSDPENFKDMIYWLKDELAKGKKIHVGCLGGHGRTGMVLSALVCVVNNDMDAIDTVREKYCKTAVETSEQEKFLAATFGMNLPLREETFNEPFYDLDISDTPIKDTQSIPVLTDQLSQLSNDNDDKPVKSNIPKI